MADAATPPYPKKLDQRLAALADEHEVMLLSEFDGFLAGIVVCPDLVMPGEWLPLIWCADDEDAEPVFDSMEDVEETVGLIMKYYNAVSNDFHRGNGYGPIFDVYRRHDEVLWELWSEGFAQAMAVRPDSWGMILEDDDVNAHTALSALVALSALAPGDEEVPVEDPDALQEVATELIAPCVITLNIWRLESGLRAPITEPSMKTHKVGRNEPCPCGSGKKYKKCCGLN
ncbi:UPF0149 family protein [Amorphus sp. MBR-141]